MHFNFQQNRVNRSVITVHTNLFAKNRKLQRFPTTNSNYKKSILSDMHHHKTYMHNNVQQNRVRKSVKTVKQIYLQKIASCINLQLPIETLKKSID